MSEETSHTPRLVRDLMTVGVTTCPVNTPVEEVARTLLTKELEGVALLDERGHAVGVVTRDELARAYSRGQLAGLTAEEIMRDGVPQVPPDIPLNVAVQIMQDLGVRILYMMHHAGGIEYPAAVLTYRHLLRHIAAEDESELADLGIKAEREPPLESFIRRRDEARRRSQSDRT